MDKYTVNKPKHIWRATQKKVRLTRKSPFDLHTMDESSHGVLSAIFGILRKFCLGICFFKNFIIYIFRRKKIDRKNIWKKKWSKKYSIFFHRKFFDHFFFRKKRSKKSIFKSFANPKISIFEKKISKIKLLSSYFSYWKIIFEIYFAHVHAKFSQESKNHT